MKWNVSIRPLREADALPMNAFWNDRPIRRSLREGPRFRTIDDARVYIHFSRGRGESGRDMAIDVDGQFAGCVSWEYADGVFSGNAELAYWVGAPFRGEYVATRAIIEATRFLFGRRGIRRIFAQVGAPNIASARALERAGYRCEAVLRESLVIEGRIQDCLVYATLRSEWQSPL